MKTSRVSRPLAAALAALALLSGCALLPEAPIDSTITPTVAPSSTTSDTTSRPGAVRRELVSAIEKIAGVEGAELENWREEQVDIAVLVSEWSTADLVSIATMVTTVAQARADAGITTLRITSLRGQPAEIRVSFPSAISREDFAREFDFWAALTLAYDAPLSLRLWTEPPSIDYSRQLSGFTMPTDDQLAAMRDVPDEFEGVTQLSFAGSEFESLDAFAAMPTESMNALEIAINDLAPEGALNRDSVTYSSKKQSVDVTSFFAEFNRTNPKLSEEWPRALQVVQLILDQGYTHASFRSIGGQPSVVHFGWCVYHASTDYAGADDALWAALSSSGLSFPEGSGPGECLDW